MKIEGKIVEFKDVEINIYTALEKIREEYLSLIGIGHSRIFLKKNMWTCDGHLETALKEATEEEIKIEEAFTLIMTTIGKLKLEEGGRK